MWSKKEEVSKNGMVVAVHPQASLAGLEILKNGGNAIDAAVATSFVAGAVLPTSCGIGGGGFMIIYLHDREKVIIIDCNMKAGSKARPDEFTLTYESEPYYGMPYSWPSTAGPFGGVIRRGYQSIAVPGTLAGLCWALEKFGTMELDEVVHPAIKICKEGVEVYTTFIKERQVEFSTFPASAKIFLKPDGSPYLPGERFTNRDLAKTYKRIADGGPDVFYKGEIADFIISDIEKNGGLITSEDLANFKLDIHEQVSSTYRENKVIYIPGASGGPTEVEIFNILEGFNLSKLEGNSPKSIHILAEAMKLAAIDRFTYMGDPDFVKVPINGLISKNYAEERRDEIDLKKALPPYPVTQPGNPWKYELTSNDNKSRKRPSKTVLKIFNDTEPKDTTHISVVDRDRNVVSFTMTLLSCSSVVVKDTGILMNNGHYWMNPLKGLPNSIAPEKRPLANMAPLVIIRDEEPFLVLGAPGGRRIWTTVPQVAINVIDYGMNIQTAIDSPKFTCEGAHILVETRIPFLKKTIRTLKTMGHSIGERPTMASPHCILIDSKTGLLHGGADSRQPGMAAGY